MIVNISAFAVGCSRYLICAEQQHAFLFCMSSVSTIAFQALCTLQTAHVLFFFNVLVALLINPRLDVDGLTVDISVNPCLCALLDYCLALLIYRNYGATMYCLF